VFDLHPLKAIAPDQHEVEVAILAIRDGDLVASPHEVGCDHQLGEISPPLQVERRLRRSFSHEPTLRREMSRLKT
jgi:hypothetical protein